MAWVTRSMPSLGLIQPQWTRMPWDCLAALARSFVCSALERGILKGRVEIHDCDGSTMVFGQPLGSEKCREISITVNDESFWVRIYLHYDVGFAESYMNGEFTCYPSIKELLNIYVDNVSTVGPGLWSIFFTVKNGIDIVLQRFFRHGFRKSIENIAAYDASNDFYKAFLSREMQYSCPIWGPEEGGVRGDLEGKRSLGDLEAAQARKINYAIRKSRLKPGGRLLEIGSGWGTVAIAAGKMGCYVDSLTLSVEQKRCADARIKTEGLQDRVRVHLMDYRNMPPEFEKAFDACISLEMVEAVGIPYMATYLRQIDWALKNSDAGVVISATTYPEWTFTPLQGDDFTRKYHWPNTIAASATWMADQFHSILKGSFSFETVEDFGAHYPRCLREWGRRLEENWSPLLIESLQERHPNLKDPHLLAVFKRRWTYMFEYMEVAYSRAWLSLHFWTFVRPGYPAESCA